MQKGKRHMTSRDLDVIEFLESTTLYANADQLSRMFYWTGNVSSSVKKAQERLRILTNDCKQIKRIRETHVQEYIYYMSKNPPRAYRHKLMNTEFLSHFWRLEGITVHRVYHEWTGIEKEYGLRPDLYIEFDYYGKDYVCVVEVDNTKKFSNGSKYSRVLLSREYDKETYRLLPPGRTFIISVCKWKPETDIPIIWVQPDMSGLSKVSYKLSGVSK